MSFTFDNTTDNYITDKKSWEKIKDFIPTDKTIWSPFYCDGKQKDYFKEMGIDIIHKDEDFFENNKGDIIIDNPPFSKLRPILERIKKINKPFILIMPTDKVNAIWFQNLFKDSLQLIIPNKKIMCSHLNPDIKFSFNWGLYYYCYKMNLPKDLIFLE
jgi:hypothetical protein